ncbi:MAG: peptide chain release factor 2 [Patescibacteria group bacterium]
MENLIKKIEELREKFLNIWKLLKIEDTKIKIQNLKQGMNQHGFWDNREQAIAISREAENEEKKINTWENLKKEIIDLEQLVAEAIEEKDNSINDEAREKYEELEKKFADLEFIVLFSFKYDQHNAILSIHAGTGGVDAQDWAEILERMYLRFAEQQGWKTEIVDRNIGNEAGIKSVTCKINGQWAYGNLKSENGVHRLVRISPFDAENMRHTSFALVEVIPEMPESEAIDIIDSDLRIDVFRSSGPGGQSVNTTDSAVRIIHKPTGLTVTCQTQRSQHQNKEIALKILKSKIFKLEEEKQELAKLELRGQSQKAEWGKQIRSYVMQPYQMVKDHRTNYETSDIKTVLDGNLNGFIEAYLRSQKIENRK